MLFTSVRGSFAARIFAVYALMLLVAAGILGGSFIWYGKRRAEADLLERGFSLTEILAAGARTGLYAESPVLVDDVLGVILGKRHVVAAAVYTADGEDALARLGESEELRGAVATLRPRPASGPGVFAGPRGCATLRTPRFLDVTCPVVLEHTGPSTAELFFEAAPAPGPAETIGTARVLVDRDIARAQVRNLALGAALLTLALLVCGTVIVLLLARRVTSPLTRLTEEVQQLGEAGTAREIEVRRRDEIGRLAAAFNAMLRSLAEREKAQSELEERLRTARKMEAVGTLSRGIAHDFNNILSTVSTAVHVLERSNPDNATVREYAGRIRVSVGHARELIERLMAFSRAKLPELRPLDLVETVRGLAPMLREAAGEETEVLVELPPAPLRVSGDREGIRQVLLNLCYNARDAMLGGGTLRIAVAPGNAAGGPVARVSVSDSGTGMEPAVRGRIFEPFYSTKEVGRGTGLGLAIVHGIVEEHGGNISVASAPGAGTTFTIDLPLEHGEQEG